MDSAQWIVTLGGAAAIAGVLWFFFFSERERIAADVSTSGAQEVRVVIKGGYSPDRIVVKRGIPVRLDFYRDETSSCTDTVVLGDFGISRSLPPYRTTPVEFTPDKPGEFTFHCGMNMVHGKLIVED
jgi:plastocyanin domain-containing protein